MRKIKLAKKAAKGRLKSEYYERDLEDSIAGFYPGEWALLEGEQEEAWCMVNPHVTQGPVVRVLIFKKFSDCPSEELLLDELLEKAFERRRSLKHLGKGSRLVYGQADNLPGLVVDQYLNCCLIQINTAGLDRHRDFIKNKISKTFQMPTWFLDKKSYRQSEGLPEYPADQISDIEVEENGIKYFIESRVLQKVGHYYDHRENRRKLNWWLQQWDRPVGKACDLFCYCGSWGLNALKGNENQIEKMIFVDQADMAKSIDENLTRNGFEGKGEFVREDVLKWLEHQEKQSFDLLISDPPAFSKSLKNKAKALGGYEKLFHKSLPLMKDDSLYVAASCTHGISLSELDRAFQTAAAGEFRSVQLLDTGIQGPDHPTSSLSSGENYIKFLLYRLFR